MNPWVMADPHLGHTGLSDDGFRPAGFSEKVIKALSLNAASCQGKGDPIIFLGDIAFNEEEKWHKAITSLPGKKWLIKGNHDRRSLTWYLDRGWDFVCESMSLTIFGKNILFSHQPQVVQSSATISHISPDPGVARCQGESLHYAATGYDLNIHGHFHNFGAAKVAKTEPHLFKILTPQHYLMCLEKLNYQPVKLDWVVKQAQKTHTLKQIEEIDNARHMEIPA